jgi:UDP-3-O-[3-hydroxymyristoyl] glucosamine N-acyltransferase
MVSLCVFRAPLPASESEISFIGNKKYEKFWADSKACVAVVNEDIE